MVSNLYLRLRNAILLFASHFPALRIGISFLFGIASTFHLSYLFMGFVLFFFEKKYLQLMVIGAGYFYCSFFYPDPQLQQPLLGSGVFQIKQIKRHPTPFKPLLVYEGTLCNFQSDTQAFYRLPCRLYMPMKKKRPLGSQDYLLSNVSLMEIGPQRFILKTNKQSEWIPIEKTHNWAERRFRIKKQVRHWVKKTFHKKPVQELIAGLLTGHNESRLQSFQFGLIGLQHLLAISGFHFALLAFFITFLLRPLFSRKVLSALLILLLSLYFVYMGEAPSISRAWIGILVFLGGALLERQSSALNALGVGLLTALILHPLVVLDVGFQLSFAATLGILLFYAPFESKLQTLFPKRSFQTIKTLPLIDQWGCVVSTYLRKVLALNGSVIVFTLPLLLTHFHRFPLISLFYNLFLPLLFSLMIAILLIGMLFPFIFPFLELYSTFLLFLVTYAPKRFFFTLRIENFPYEIALILCLSFFLLGIYLKWSSSLIKEWSYS